MGLRAARLGRGEQPVDQRRGGAVRRGAEKRRAARPSDARLELAQVGELERRIGAREVRKGRRHPRAGLTVGQHRGYLEPRMLRDEPQQLAGDVAGAAEHERRCALAHAPATFASPTLRSGSRDIR